MMKYMIYYEGDPEGSEHTQFLYQEFARLHTQSIRGVCYRSHGARYTGPEG